MSGTQEVETGEQLEPEASLGYVVIPCPIKQKVLVPCGPLLSATEDAG